MILVKVLNLEPVRHEVEILHLQTSNVLYATCNISYVQIQSAITQYIRSVPWFRRSVRRPRTAEERVQPSTFHVGFVVDKAQLMLVYIPVLRSSPVSTIPPVFHVNLSIYRRRCITSAVDTIVKRQTLTQNSLIKCLVTI